jgi:hypothetical protein
MPSEAKTRLVVFFDGILDHEILNPVLCRAAADSRFAVASLMTRRFKSAMVGSSAGDLSQQVLSHRLIRYFGYPKLKEHYDVLLTTAESSAPAHATAHALTRRANRSGLFTATLQHGLENVGLTYLDGEHDERTRVAAKRVYLWGPRATLHPAFTNLVGGRSLSVGCPKPKAPRTTVDGYPNAVLVCENLHWSRFSDSFRSRFVADISATAASHPQLTFFIRPHPAGRWLNDREHSWPSNVQFLKGNSLFASTDFVTLMEKFSRVITTPSTVAFDAARAGKMIAIVGYELDLPAYTPLPLIKSQHDWASFLKDSSSDQTKFRSDRDKFLQRVCVEGDAVARILDDITLAACRRGSAADYPNSSRRLMLPAT